jgi:hypothetical protein
MADKIKKFLPYIIGIIILVIAWLSYKSYERVKPVNKKMAQRRKLLPYLKADGRSFENVPAALFPLKEKFEEYLTNNPDKPDNYTYIDYYNGFVWFWKNKSKFNPFEKLFFNFKRIES